MEIFLGKTIRLCYYGQRRKSVEAEDQTAIQPNEPPVPAQESTPPAQQAPSPEEPILLSKLFPEAKHDLDALFPDPHLKQLLREVHRTRQGNQRFLKRLNLAKLQLEGEDPDSDS
jgi:hypothetical protein